MATRKNKFPLSAFIPGMPVQTHDLIVTLVGQNGNRVDLVDWFVDLISDLRMRFKHVRTAYNKEPSANLVDRVWMSKEPRKSRFSE